MTVKWYSKEVLGIQPGDPRNERATMAEGVRFEDHIRMSGEKGVIAEFISAGQFADAFYQRQRYEIDMGRDEEPELWQPIYDVEINADLPEVLPINYLGPAGVTFNEITEGGEVKFMTMSESDKSIRQRQYGIGLQYTKKMMMFNSVWNMSMVERQVGVGHNALMNHIHLYPIIAADYAGASQATSASSVGSTVLEKMMSTLEDAIDASKTDQRRGPYVLLIAGGDSIKVQNMMNIRVQDANGAPRAGAGMVSAVIEYDGWSGTRGALTTTYTGVGANTAYLVSLQYKYQDFISKHKQTLQSAMGNPDVSRFIMEQTVWDVWFGMLATPLAAVQKLTWPTS